MNITKIKEKIIDDFFEELNLDFKDDIQKILEIYFENEDEIFNFILTRSKEINAHYKYEVHLYDLMRDKLELPEMDRGLYEVVDQEIRNIYSSLQVRPFDFIKGSDPNKILMAIHQELPQTIAVILSFLDPAKAASVLNELPYEVRDEVCRRIVIMGECSPETLREIERVLEKKLCITSSEEYTRSGGLNSLVEILNLTDKDIERAVINNLEDEDPEMAENLKEKMFIFEDIVALDDRSIQKVMRDIDSQELATALINVDSEVQNKFFRNMSKRASSMLKEDMAYMGPMKIKQIEIEQKKIVNIIRKLEDEGEIVIPRNFEEEYVCADVDKLYKDDDPEETREVNESTFVMRCFHNDLKPVVAQLNAVTLLVACQEIDYDIVKKFANCFSLFWNIIFRICVKRYPFIVSQEEKETARKEIIKIIDNINQQKVKEEEQDNVEEETDQSS